MKTAPNAREVAFDGLVGPTHHYAGLSLGNLASTEHAGREGNPRAAALQGIAKMRSVQGLGGGQAVLPPQERPCLAWLRRLGFTGSDADVLEKAYRSDPALLSTASSASAMWAANAATVSASADSGDGRVHFTPANLVSMLHRSLEAKTTERVLRALFADEAHFCVHEPLPAHSDFSDEGAANHTRLVTSRASLNLFAWGRGPGVTLGPARFPARQSRPASEAVARLHDLPDANVLLWQQAPTGIDAGAFHTDVLAVGCGRFLMLHEHAFVDTPALLAELASRLGDEWVFTLASESELPVADAVACYPFNSALVPLEDGSLVIVAPEECRRKYGARRFLERVVAAEDNPVTKLEFVDVNDSMRNGGGPACLRLRVPLTEVERGAVRGRVWFDTELNQALGAWVEKHYRDRLTQRDLTDPQFLSETREALDALTQLLKLGSLYDFQR
ncbi:MAG: N-succinylarginine dihydrolase [Polyangiaceae bacterium]